MSEEGGGGRRRVEKGEEGRAGEGRRSPGSLHCDSKYFFNLLSAQWSERLPLVWVLLTFGGSKNVPV